MLNGGAWGPPLITVDSMHISGCPMGCIHRSKIVEVENSTQAGRTHRGCNKKFSLRSSRSTLHSTRTCNGVDGPAKADHAGLQYRTRVVPITCWWGFLGGKVPDYWKSEFIPHNAHVCDHCPAECEPSSENYGRLYARYVVITLHLQLDVLKCRL